MKLPLSINPRSLFLAIGLILSGWLLGSLFRGEPSAGGSGTASQPGATTWTCSMHPQIQQPKPGKCPICAMDLIPLSKAGAGKEGPRQLLMTNTAKQLAKIQTAPVIRKVIDAEIRLVGKVAFDETTTKTVAAYFPARIDRLYVDYTGIPVRKGDHLAQVYSPELLSAQSELLTALRFRDNVEVARDKLRLWGLSEERIRAIETSGKTSDRLDIDTPMSGIVIRKHVNEGDYLKTGQPLFTIADLNTVWMQLDAYESDLPWLRFGQPVTFEAEAIPGRQFTGIVSFVSPMLDPKTRTIKVRVIAENPGQLLKPDMFVHATVRATLAGEGKVVAPELAGKWISPMHPEIVRDEPGQCPVCGMDLVRIEDLGYTVLSQEEQPPLVVPSSAVLRTGKRSVVYVEVSDADQPTYQGREILIGPRAGNHYIIKEGLMEGERIVVQGNFKIDSALQIMAKPSMMNPDGSGAGGSAHDHGDGGGKAPRMEVREMLTFEVSPEFRTQLDRVYQAYLTLQEALVGSDLESAQRGAGSVIETLARVDMNLLAADAHLEWMNHLAPIRGSAELIRSAKSLELARSAFLPLSQTLIRAAHVFGSPLDQALSHAHCPMAFDDKGGDWLQLGEEIRNPYFGDAMLQCGVIKATLERPSESPPRYEASPKFQEQLGTVLQAYENTRKGLAADDLGTAQAAVSEFHQALKQVDMSVLQGEAHLAWMGELPHLETAASALATATELAAARKTFKSMSEALIRAVRHFGVAGVEQVYLTHCPMAFDDQGASWLQLTRDILNPYFGAEMLQCGFVEEELLPASQDQHDHGNR